MDTETMIRELESVEEKHKDDAVYTGQLNIAEMAHDVRKRLEELKPYEDTDLTPQQIKDMQFCLREKSRECAELRREIQELKERDTAKRPVEFDEHWYKCPGCGKYAGGLKGNFCHVCGQRLKWED